MMLFFDKPCNLKERMESCTEYERNNNMIAHLFSEAPFSQFQTDAILHDAQVHQEVNCTPFSGAE